MANAIEIELRKNQALDAIKKAVGAKTDEYGATLFVQHHLKELPSDYWQKYLESSSPEPVSIWTCNSVRTGERTTSKTSISLSPVMRRTM